MKQKIRKIVTAALLSMMVLGMTAPTLPASAATGSGDECKHTAMKLISTNVVGYPRVTQHEHEVIYVDTYTCTNCYKYSYANTYTALEPHRQKESGSLECVCGYYLY